MKKTLLLAAAAIAGGAFADSHLTGPLAARLDAMVERHVAATDVDAITRPFAPADERHGRWQSEFWGKWMHSAAPFAELTGDARLKAKIARGVEAMLAAQEPGGYLGNYPDGKRCGTGGWDVWGMKYTMMGLLHAGDAKSLAAARRLCDYLIAEIGPNGRRGRAVWQTGSWCGMPSSSVLEPVVWLYRRTGEAKYLDFATFIVKGLVEPAEGPRLVDLALKGVKVADRNGHGFKVKENPVPKIHNRLKSYEEMSCYQGMLDYVEVKKVEEVEKVEGVRTDDILKAAVMTAKEIAADEVNLAGGCSRCEEWFGGAAKQHLPSFRLQETCVTITWMRLAAKLLAVTGDPFWADELEKTFYNAYLAALKTDGSEFAAYTPLTGSRSSGMDHCHLHVNCCNANGPRGFLAFLDSILTAREGVAKLAFYASGSHETALDGEKVSFDVYTHYPKANFARIVNRTPAPRRFALDLRIPAWSAKTAITIDGEPVADVKPGAWCRIDREWRPGDGIDVFFDLATRVHTLSNHVAFTRGPILLARDSRFREGPLDEPLRAEALAEGFAPAFTAVRRGTPEMNLTVAAVLPLGVHSENPDGALPSVVRFCDYASAANLWRPDNDSRTWFPVEQ